jgi:hypothetical protein
LYPQQGLLLALGYLTTDFLAVLRPAGYVPAKLPPSKLTPVEQAVQVSNDFQCYRIWLFALSRLQRSLWAWPAQLSNPAAAAGHVAQRCLLTALQYVTQLVVDAAFKVRRTGSATQPTLWLSSLMKHTASPSAALLVPLLSPRTSQPHLPSPHHLAHKTPSKVL